MYKLGKFTEELRITSGSCHRFHGLNWHIAPLLVGETLMLLHVDTSVSFSEDRFCHALEKLSEIAKSVAVTDVFIVKMGGWSNGVTGFYYKAGDELSSVK